MIFCYISLINIYIYIFIKITKHQNIYDLCNKIKKKVHEAGHFIKKYFRFALHFHLLSFLLLPQFVFSFSSFFFSSSAKFLLYFFNHDLYIQSIINLVLFFFKMLFGSRSCIKYKIYWKKLLKTRSFRFW